MNCLFCPNHKMTRPRGDMPFSLAKSVLNQLSEGDFRGSVITSLMGEPLLHPEFLPIVNHGVGPGLRMNVITNFVCVPEKIGVPDLLNSGIDTLVLSYQTPSEKLFSLRKAPLSFVQYRNKLKEIIRFAKENKINTRRIEIHILQSFQFHLNCRLLEDYSLIEQTIAEFASWRESTERKNNRRADEDPAGIVRKFRRGRQHQDVFDIPLGNGIFAVLKRAGTWANSLLPIACTVALRLEGNCDEIRKSLGVFWDGRCTVCCQDFDSEVCIGNAHCQRLADMMKEGPLAHLMRMEELGRLVHPLCQKCRGRVLLANKPFRREKPIGAANRFFQYAHRAGERLGGMRNTLMRH